MYVEIKTTLLKPFELLKKEFQSNMCRFILPSRHVPPVEAGGTAAPPEPAPDGL